MKSRAYDQTLRAQKAADNEARILDVAEALFESEPFDRVTLAAVAEGAGVTIPTIQRRFGGKDGLFTAWGARVRARVASQRGRPPIGDVRACVAELVAHYELEGRLVWHLLRQEADVAALREPLAEGRRQHRGWVEAVFGAALDRIAREERRARVDALVAVTDVYTWKLLRLDLGRSRADVESLMHAMAVAVAGGT